MVICAANANDGMVFALVETVDCHIRVLVQESYRELVGPNTVFAAAFTGLLTIYIALLGYQLLFGRGGLRVTELPVTALKVGLILAFLTSWAAYQTVFFGLLFDGPRQLMQAMLSPMARAGSGFDGDVYGGLERAFADMSRAASTYGAQASPAANILQGGPMLGAGILWLSGIGMLLASIGVILAVKIVLAFLLAVGPIFIGFFLFETTRGLFDGWIRTTIAFAVAPLMATVFGAAMLMMLQPFLGVLSAKADAGVFDMGPIITIALIVAVFALIMGMAVRVGASLTSAFSTARPRSERTEARDARVVQQGLPAGADRAEQVAARLAMGERASQVDAGAAGIDLGRRPQEVADAMNDTTPASQRLGQTYRRTPRPTAAPTGGLT
jgi:type IV secretion system protein VirB6